VDPFSLLLLAQTAVGAITAGCEMLREGKAIIDEFKDEAEGVVSQVNEAIETVTGLWDWATGLWASFTGKPKKEAAPEVSATTEPIKSLAKKQVKKAAKIEHDPDILQMQTVHEVSQNLGKFFDIQQKIQSHYKDLEEESLHVYEENQNHAMKAIERVEVELQLEEMTVKIRETMVYAPKELKDLYSRFLTMYGHIKEEQEFARQEQIRNARNKRWRLEARRNFRIDLLAAAMALGVVILVVWWMMAQVAMLSGFSTGCCSLLLSAL
jgi:hypothetical protein